MDSVNKTLYIPLYGKSYVSKKGLFLRDEKAEEIWAQETFKLKGKAKSKWLAYYMGIRAVVFDEWVKEQAENKQEAVVLHIGCGMDSRSLRLENLHCKWYDVDFPDVIQERKRYYTESENYQMLAGDVREDAWLKGIPESKCAIVAMEGVSMYLSIEELQKLLTNICLHFEQVVLLMDCYSVFAAKMSKHKNPVKSVGVTKVYGINEPTQLQSDTFIFVQERVMTPKKYIEELHGLEKFIFKKLYAGGLSKKLYRLFEYKKVERLKWCGNH